MAFRKLSLKDGLYYLYVMECVGIFKVGWSIEPGARLAEVQTGNPFPISLFKVYPVPGGLVLKIEGAVHAALRRHRYRGEWFQAPIDAVMTAVDDALTRFGVPLLTVEEVAHRLAQSYLASQEKASVVRKAVAKARVGQLISRDLEATNPVAFIEMKQRQKRFNERRRKSTGASTL